MGSQSCSVKSANPSEFQLDTTDCYVCCTGEMVACILQFIEEGSWNIEQFYLITLTNIDFDQSKTKWNRPAGLKGVTGTSNYTAINNP